MTVEENQRNLRENESKNKFPVGMRVLAVDDDPTCLKLLENLLRRCEYHVTITGQAVTALKLLRENRDKFDLVISDVHMPDMDGFKLLELVGLEMDLPVIMLSGNSDTKAVMNGIAHGACDYLLKPVRIEELKNIWQHVVRRKKFDSMDHRDDNEIHHGTDEGGQGPVTVDMMDQKLNRKRKDQNEDDDDEFEENGHENEDPSSQKKPRVVWSVELHRKFVAAVNQLGIDKAVPKRILDLMNVDRLTRENVASHLQKYRLYLKRISCVASQHGNLTAALGGIESPFAPMGLLEGLNDFRAMASGQLPNTTLASFQLGSTSVGLSAISPSGMPQLGRIHNSSNSINDLGKLHQLGLSKKQHGNLLHGLPMTLEFDPLHPKQPIPYLGEFSGPVDDSPVFSINQNRLAGFGSLNRTGVTTGSSSSAFLSAPGNPLMLQLLGNQSPVTVAAMDPEPFEVNVGVSSHLADHDRCNSTWQNAVPLTGYSANPLPMGVPLNHDDLSSTTLRDNVLLSAAPIDCNPFDVSANTITAGPSHDQVMGKALNCQEASLVDVNARCVSGDLDENSNLLTLESIGYSVGHCISYGQQHVWGEQKPDCTHNSNVLLSSLRCSVTSHSPMGPTGQNMGQNTGVCDNKVNTISRGRGLKFMSQCGNEQSAVENPMKLKEEYLFEHAKLDGGFNPISCSPFDSLINTMTKRDRNEAAFMDEDIGCDVYPLGTCMRHVT